MNANESPKQEVSQADPARGESVGNSRPRRGGDGRDGVEWWVRIAALLAVLLAAAWGVVLARLGTTSLYAHIFVIPVVGGLTLPVILWGLIKTVFNPPLVRFWRMVGFGLLLGVGFFGTVPMFPVPLATADRESETEFRVPFDGEWVTLAGGRVMARNYHATTAAYRWGYDFAPLEDGKRFEGEGEELSDYACFGRPVLAPAAGDVVVARDDRKDYPPREFDETSALGNHVVLRVDDGVYLFVAHLREGSLEVEPTDRVERGEPLGECGNSGRAVEPHVHVHLQDRASFPLAQSLPLRFSNYLADGEPVDRGMPRGEGREGVPAGTMVEQQ